MVSCLCMKLVFPSLGVLLICIACRGLYNVVWHFVGAPDSTILEDWTPSMLLAVGAVETFLCLLCALLLYTGIQLLRKPTKRSIKICAFFLTSCCYVLLSKGFIENFSIPLRFGFLCAGIASYVAISKYLIKLGTNELVNTSDLLGRWVLVLLSFELAVDVYLLVDAYFSVDFIDSVIEKHPWAVFYLVGPWFIGAVFYWIVSSIIFTESRVKGRQLKSPQAESV